MEMVLYTRHGVLSYMTEIPVVFRGEQCVFVPDRRDSSMGNVFALSEEEYDDDDLYEDWVTVAIVNKGIVCRYGQRIGTLEELKEGKL